MFRAFEDDVFGIRIGDVGLVDNNVYISIRFALLRIVPQGSPGRKSCRQTLRIVSKIERDTNLTPILTRCEVFNSCALAAHFNAE
jgi:hypothetical protein